MPTLNLVRSLGTTDAPPAPMAPLPDAFALADRNPRNGRRYQDSLYQELPPYAVAVIGLTRDAWNGLVRQRAVGLALDVQQVHSLAPMLAQLKARQQMVWDGDLDIAETIGVLCGECLGTSIAHDFDGSVTGVLDAPYLCLCAQQHATNPPRPANSGGWVAA
jgi:hypothetical protein